MVSSLAPSQASSSRQSRSNAASSPTAARFCQMSRPGVQSAASSLQGATVRELDLLARDELDQDGPAVLVHLSGALEGGSDLRRLLDPLGITAHRPAHVGVVTADVARAVAIVRDDERVTLDGHGGVVEHDGGDRDAAA